MKRHEINFNDDNDIILTPVEDTLYTLPYDGSWQGQKTLSVMLDVPNVSCKIICAYKVASDQVLDLVTTVTHKAPNTNSEVQLRGVLLDGGSSIYKGKIVIKNTAHGSASKLEDKTLMVGKGIYNHAEPVMQIKTNDVIASHASATGQVDEHQVFYLQSRGLSKTEAQDLLINAFLKIDDAKSSI